MSDDAIPQMREQIEALEKQLKAALKGQAEAQNTARKMTAREIARETGLDPSHGELFATSNPEADISVEALQGFAEQFKLTPSVTEAAPKAEADESSAVEESLASFPGGGSRPGSGGQPSAGSEKMTRDEWNDLNRRDPQAARVALEQGRVQLRADNPWVSQGR